MKKCFTCGWRLPLFLFSKDGMRYQRESDKGRVKVCRVCEYKRWNQVREAWKFNFISRKFEKITFESRWAILKKVLS
jgi:uncharacterized lipoprotein